MTKTDVLNGLAAKPVPFTAPGGFEVLLRPLRFGDRAAVFEWHRGVAGQPGAGSLLTRKLVSLAVCDAAGNPLLTETEVDTIDPKDADAIAGEVTRRSGIGAGGDDPGKATPPATPS